MLRFIPNCVLTFLFLCVAQPVLAWTLSGTLTGDGTAIEGGTVDLANSSTLEHLGTSVTDSDGLYTFFDLNNGSYNLTINADGYDEAVVNDVSVDDKDTVQHVALISEVTSVTLSGAVYESHEMIPIGGVSVQIVESANTSTTVWSGYTDGSGVYTATVFPGTYSILIIARNDDTSIETPSYFQFPLVSDVLVESDTDLPDTILTLVTISGRVTDSYGEPLEGFRVEHANNITQVGWMNNQFLTTDASGIYSFVVVPMAGYSFTLSPPAGSSFFQTVIGNVDILTDTERDFVPREGVTLSGTVYGPDGVTRAGGIGVLVREQSTGLQWSGVTNASGVYTATVDLGTYSIIISGSNDNTNIETPVNFQLPRVEDVLVEADTVQPDTILPFVTISGKVTGSGQPLADVFMVQDSNASSSTGSSIANQFYTTDASGVYSFIVLPMEGYEFGLRPPSESGFAITRFENIAVLTDTERDFALQESVTLSGAVYWPDVTTPVDMVWVIVREQATSDGAWAGWTNASGVYTANVVPGTYSISMRAYSLFNLPMINDIVVESDTVQPDIILPLTTISGKVTDTNGVPIAGVNVECHENRGPVYQLNPQNQLTDTSGAYSFKVFSMEGYSFTVFPPVGSGFAPTMVEDVDITSSVFQNYILNMPDTDSPLLLSGPTVSAVTANSVVISWQTNEQAMGGVKYGTVNPPTTTVYETNSATMHSIPLNNLTANTTYYINVFASDATGNGPTESDVISFTTKETPDTKAPVIISGPIVSSIDHNSAVIEWSTNEPSIGDVSYGTSGSLGQTMSEGEFSIDHSVILTGLNAETIYYFQIDATDDGDNGPTLSSLLNFNTLESPDTTAPIIVEGPMVINISDSGATIIWTTNEPATSGVSYNDGTVYGVFSDDALVTEHSVHLENLSAATLYNYTVSTKDELNNSPTLSDVKQFTTLDALDTECPVIIEYPVKHINHQQAIIAWRTDEPASNIIEYGLTFDQLTEIESRAALTMPHNMTLTGLESGTTYYFRIVSKDAGGNSCTSQVWNFTTTPAPNSNKPVVTKKPEAIYSGDDTLTVTWETDVPTDTVLEYNEPGKVPKRLSNSEKKHKHQATIKGLTPDTQYEIAVAATNITGNTTLAKMGDELIRIAFIGDSGLFIPPTTAATLTDSDITDPGITDDPTVVGASDTTVTIQWSTDEIADSLIHYGLSGEPFNTQAGNIMDVVTHTLVLTNLTPATAYDYTVESVDPSGNGPTVSSIFSFTTLAAADNVAPEFTINPTATSYSETQAVILWGTNETSTTVLHYGPTSGNLDLSSSVAGLSLDHSLSLTNLVSATTYYFSAEATDNSGNTSNSVEGSFTTMGIRARGDIDADGAIDLTDLVMALQVSVGLAPSGVDDEADVDGDGCIGIAEAIDILQQLAD